MNIKVSIIIPVYNVDPYLETCLSSCINQTFRDIEIIVVNDGSTDTSSRIIAKYAAVDERIVVVSKKNEGLIYARKSGLDIARGEYVYHLDGDDYIESDAIEILYREIIKNDSDCVIAGFNRIFGDDKQEYYWDKRMNGLSGQELLTFMIGMGLWPIWGKLIRKSLFDEIVYRKIFIGEDLYLNMQIILKVKELVVLDICLYNYVWNGNSVTRKVDEKTLGLSMEMLESVWSLLDIYPYEPRIKKQICYLFISPLVEAIKGNRTEVINILKKYYWSKKEIRTDLWKDERTFYFMCGGYIHAPRMISFGARLGSKVKAILRGLKNG
ncbi:glycosyltransferase family 2 protein [Parabacteroides gordonii]|uniref:glycosyltransferase family 2 protein n=1 Tax=Parabacteroides gordonii TaxID=574930 RepID=UPI000EBA8426|nr:glycosyltransferase family 2 protein [Parabacteroides gordonii]RGP08489.1 glycosyltransferase family 2 protein [Parabacteroides gordonii]